MHYKKKIVFLPKINSYTATIRLKREKSCISQKPIATYWREEPKILLFCKLDIYP